MKLEENWVLTIEYQTYPSGQTCNHKKTINYGVKKPTKEQIQDHLMSIAGVEYYDSFTDVTTYNQNITGKVETIYRVIRQ